MGRGVGRLLLGVCLGAALTLVADSLLRQHERNPAAGADLHKSPTGLLQQPVTALAPAHVPADASASEPHKTQVNAAEPVDPQSQTAELRMGETTFQQDEGLRSAALNALLNSSTARCDFDPGAGAYWSAGDIQTHGVSYSGGQIVYQSIDIGNGTAQMMGMPRATGSTTGELDVHVTANNAGLHFAGFTPAGSLIVTSVYATLNQSGRYMAVMSRHGHEQGHESIQVYGACDISLAAARSSTFGVR